MVPEGVRGCLGGGKVSAAAAGALGSAWERGGSKEPGHELTLERT